MRTCWAGMEVLGTSEVRPLTGSRPVWLARLAAVVAAIVLTVAVLFAGDPAKPAPTADAAAAAFAKASLAFAPNRGQAAPDVRYQAQTGGFGVAFTDSKAVLTLPGGGEGAGSAPVELNMRFVGANPAAAPTAEHRAPGTVNYVRGDEPAQWQQNIPTFSQISYPALWQGVDMAFRGQNGRLKYEFAVAPGADPANIALAYGGAQALAVGSSGGLRIETAGGTVRDAAPVSYQMVDGRRVPVESRYALNGKTGYGFEVGRYDRSLPLVIDPGIGYATFLGAGGFDEASGIKVDSAGNAYVVGTTSTDSGFAFPTTSGAFDTSGNGNYDVFVTKLAPDGGSLVYSTFIGGAGQDNGFGIAIDDAGAAYVAGSAQNGFPTTSGAADTTFGGGSHDVFVAKLAPGGGSLVYSTFHGGGGFDQGQAIAIDSAGNAYVTGVATGGFPTTPGAYDETPTFGADAFALKIAPGGGSVVYSTILGGGPSTTGNAIAVDPAGNAYVTGGAEANSVAFSYPVTAGAFDTTPSLGTMDAFVTKVAPNGGSLVYSTFLGGTRGDRGRGIDIDSDGNAYVVGETGGGNPTTAEEFPTTPGAFDTMKGSASNDGFVTKVAPNGASLVYSTLLGGDVNPDNPTGTPDAATGVVVNGSGQAYVTGYTINTDFPTTPDAQQPTRSGAGPGQDYDSFVTRVAASGASLVYSTYFGAGVGQANEASKAIDIDSSGDVYIAGIDDGEMAATPGAYDTSGSLSDAFVAKLGSSAQCSDSSDNDSDGQIDYPADQGCDSLTDNSESPDPPECNDRLDNDSDGASNYPADQGCDSLTDGSESPDAPQCNDRLDNDSDGNSNFPADQGCDSLTDNSESPDPPECNDRLDNDSDGASNYPADQGCDSLTDGSESPDAPQCNDRLDNDSDGNSNFPADQGCDSLADNSESPDPPECNDRLDNDSDGETNFPNDPGCGSASDDSEAPNPQCSDGADNDSDSLTDFPDDPGCDSTRDDSESGAAPECDDDADNDGDGHVDFPDDQGCDSLTDNSESPDPVIPMEPTEPTEPTPTVPGPTTPTPTDRTCGNRIVGDEKAERLTGTGGEDLITGRAGDDRLSGKGGKDCLHGNAGHDRVLGGTGRDRLGGGDGADVLDDEGGTDVFKSGAGPDLILAADGKRDEVRCGDGEGDQARVDPEDEVIRCERVKVVGD